MRLQVPVPAELVREALELATWLVRGDDERGVGGSSDRIDGGGEGAETYKALRKHYFLED